MKTFREWLREKELNEAEKLVVFKDLSYIKSDKGAYSDLHKLFIDKKNKLMLTSTYYGDDEEILKHQELLNKEAKKYKIVSKEVKYMFDDKDNEYRNTLFEIE